MPKFGLAEVVTEETNVLEKEVVVKQEGVEVFRSTLNLVLKKWEKRQSEQSKEHYYMFYFDTCVRFNPDNVRENRYILMPLYISAETSRRCLSKEDNIKDKLCKIDVVFYPSLFKGKNGEMFSNFRAEIENIEVLDTVEEPF